MMRSFGRHMDRRVDLMNLTPWWGFFRTQNLDFVIRSLRNLCRTNPTSADKVKLVDHVGTCLPSRWFDDWRWLEVVRGLPPTRSASYIYSSRIFSFWVPAIGFLQLFVGHPKREFKHAVEAFGILCVHWRHQSWCSITVWGQLGRLSLLKGSKTA